MKKSKTYRFKNEKVLYIGYHAHNLARIGFLVDFGYKEFKLFLWKFHILYEDDLPF